jgi:hypothetical protein
MVGELELNETDLKNDSVSRPPPQLYRRTAIIIGILTTVAYVFAISISFPIFSLPDFLNNLLFATFLSIAIAALFIGLVIYIGIYPNRIYLGKEELIIIQGQKRVYVRYKDIDSFKFSYLSFDKNGDPCPRWVIRWNKGIFKRLISLTDKNAKELAKRLDELNIHYIWDEHLRKAWEEQIMQSPHVSKQSR